MNGNNMRRDIRRFFRRYAAASVNIPSSLGNIYELFVYVLVCEEIQRNATGLQLHSQNPGTFIFRSSPGLPNPRFSYFSFQGPQTGKIYQLWNGIEILGHSGMEHEADICIFRTSSRTALPSPTFDHVAMAIECKCYSSPSNLKGEVRKNLGMVQDWSESFHPSNSGRGNRGCIHCGLGFTPAFVTNVRQRQRLDIQVYLEAYELQPQFGVLPGARAVSDFNNLLSSAINQM